jgi:hypothetical protein
MKPPSPLEMYPLKLPKHTLTAV